MSVIRFWTWSSLIAAALLAIGWLLVTGLMPQYSPYAVLVAVLVAWVPALIAYAITYPGLEQNMTGFVGRLLGGMAAKMLTGIMTIVVVAVAFKAQRNEYVVTYILAYFIFTGFEVYSLMRKLRPQSGK
ncbi:MAG: hypothetical protein SF053_07885 [Bacteroidia bacterium]|nr:hypothetical protein [Bacteroidia bacterium]